MINKITFFITLGLVILGLNVNAQTTRFIIDPATASIDLGDTLVVKVTSQDFTDLLAFNHSINWDPTILEFIHNQDEVNSVHLPNGFNNNTAQADMGRISIIWEDPDLMPQSVDNDSVLYEIVRFRAIGYGTTDLTFPDNIQRNNILYFNGAGQLQEELPLVSEATVTVEDPAAEPGDYDCMFTGFGMAIESDSAATGDQVCLSVYNCNWDSITSYQHSINFNPAVLQFDSVDNINIPQPDELIYNANNTSGFVVMGWLDTLNQGVTFDDSIAYDLCFTVIGAGGEMDTISITSMPANNEVTDVNSMNGTVTFPMETEDGHFVVAGNSGSAVTVVAAEVDGSPGDTVCVAVTTQNFVDLTAFQFSMGFDTSNLIFHEIQNINTDLPDFANAINSTPMLTDTGAISVLYPEPSNMAFTLMNGDTLFEACFIIKANATVGDDALVGFSDNPVARGAVQTMPAPLLSNDGHVTIVAGNLPDGIQLSLQDVDVCPDSTFCVPVIADYGFTDVAIANFRVFIDNSVHDYSGIQNEHPSITGSGDAWSGGYNATLGRISFLLSPNDFATTFTVPAGETVFEICFDAPIDPTPGSTDITIDPLFDFGLMDGSGITPSNVNGSTITVTNDACPPGETPITVSESITNVSCAGGANGIIALTIAGGDGTPPMITWTDEGGGSQGTTATIIGLTAGVYTVNITSGSQTFTDMYTVTEPDPIDATADATNVSCNGAGDGAITLTIGGGTPTYTVEWSNNSTTQNLIDLDPGMYTPTITDMNGCTVELGAIEITEPTVLAVSIDSTTNISCLGDNDGAIYTTVTGGTPDGGGDYTFTWMGTTQTTEDITGLTAGNYQVTVTDENGCTAVSAAVTLTQPSTTVAITVDQINPVNCNGPGGINISVTGGSPNYTYAWNNSTMDEDLTGVAAGGYIVTVTDMNGCTEESGIIQVPTTPAISIDETVAQPNCDSQSDGIINLTVTGGTGDGFNYAWDTGETTPNRTDLLAGTYTVTVTDMTDGCTATETYTLTNQINLAITETASTPAGCAGATNGSLTVEVMGGSGNYTYLWTPSGQTNPALVNVTAGNYTVDVTDTDSGCTASGTFTVNSDGGIVITEDGIVDATCTEASNGSVNISVTGGGANPTFIWSDDNATNTEDLSGVEPGMYSVTVTSTDGLCTQTGTFTVGAGPGFDIIMNSIGEATCAGAENGTVDISVSGQTGMPIFEWSTGSTTEDISNAVGGSTAMVTVTDAAGCTEVGSYVIPAGNGFDINLDNIQNASCGGATDGGINITLVGASGTPTFEWSNTTPTITTEDLSGVAAGSYTVTATDEQGCVVTATYTIDNDGGISAAVQSIEATSCNGSSDGAINLDVLNASANLTFVWAPQGTGQNPVGLPADTYAVTITDDDSGCTTTIDNIIVGEPDVITLDIDNNDVSCNGLMDGSITITPQGGTPGFTYAWDHDATLPPTTNGLTNLSPGSYIVTVTDSRGCSVVSNGITISEPDAVVVTGQVTNISGTGNNGAIDLTVTGGSGTYNSFVWDFMGTELMGQNLTGLSAGTYDVTVTDDQGCTGTNTFTVNAADAPNPTLVMVTDASCFGTEDGAIDINVTGGTPNYTYQWSDANIPNTTQDPTGLEADTYSVTVTDADGVTAVLSGIVVGQAADIDYELNDLLSVSCPGGDDGMINITPIGGDGGPYTVEWGFPTPDPLNVTGLSSGTYNPTITDASGCSVIGDNINVNQPEPIEVTIEELIDPTCANGMVGVINVDVTGGSEPYVYNWELVGQSQTFPSSDVLSNVGPGQYMLTVTDDNDCTMTAGPYELSGVDAIIVQLDSVVNVTCPNLAEGAIYITYSGGTGQLTPVWTNSDTGETLSTGAEDLVGLIGGNYTVTIMDEAGCSETLGPINVAEPEPITYTSIEIVNVTAAGDDGEITFVGVTGGNGGYTYTWNGPNGEMFTTTVPTIDNATPGIWEVVITDSEGCQLSVDEEILVDGILSITSTTTDPDCNGGNNGTITLVLNNAAPTPPPTYEWTASNGGTGIVDFAPNQLTLTAGTYTVTVTDGNGVQATETFVLTDPDPIEVEFEISNVNGSDCNGSIDMSTSGGAFPLTYIWNNGDTSEDLFNVCKGTYSVTIVDANGCVAIPPAQMVTSGPLVFLNVDAPTTSCNNGNSLLTATAGGGCAPYTFTLDPGTPQEEVLVSQGGTVTFTGITAGDHTLVLSDGTSTPVDFTFPVMETQIIVTENTITDNTETGGDCNGAINIDVNGGQVPYTYLWSTGDTSQDLSNVCPNQTPANVTVTDANECIVVSAEFIVIQGITAVVETTDETCVDAADGSIIVDASGGLPAPEGYDYEWSNGATTPNLTGLEPGTYTLTITDDSGRTATITETINGSDTEITVEAETVIPTGTNADGSIIITVSGGAPGEPDYQWLQNGMEFSNSKDIFGLTPGTYTLIYTDAYGCIYTQSFNINGLEITLVFEEGNSACAGAPGDNGTLEVIASGGAEPYTYQWVDGQSSNIIGGLAVGDYQVTVTDATGLTAAGTGTVNELQPVTVTLEADEVNRRILSTVTGGVEPYTYRWNDSAMSTTSDLENVAAGNYTLVVTDANGCIGTEPIDFRTGPCEEVTKIITPNNDGFNDEFEISCTNRFSVELEIYNRWGKLVYMSPAYTNDWTGIDLDGDRVPEGGYFYVIRYQDADGTQQIKGSFNLAY